MGVLKLLLNRQFDAGMMVLLLTHLNEVSTLHREEQPSPSSVLPSSHCCLKSKPSPQNY